MGIFSKEDKENPLIVFNFTSQATEHAILRRYPEDKNILTKYVSPRVLHKCYPTVVSHTMDPDKKKKILKKQCDITVEHAKVITIAKGQWDQYMDIEWLFPKNPDDLPVIFQSGKLSPIRLIVEAINLELQIQDLVLKDRNAAYKKLKEAGPRLTELSNMMTDSIINDIKKKNSLEKEESETKKP